MQVRISKIINWDGKEYAFVVDSEPNQFCDFCAFSELCQKVIIGTLRREETPMQNCKELCEQENTHYANFLPINIAENYVAKMNKYYEDRNDQWLY